MMVKTKKTQENELLKNMDFTKQDSKLQKDVESMIAEEKKKQAEKDLLNKEK
jgi:hypothetical protein